MITKNTSKKWYIILNEFVCVCAFFEKKNPLPQKKTQKNPNSFVATVVIFMYYKNKNNQSANLYSLQVSQLMYKTKHCQHS